MPFSSIKTRAMEGAMKFMQSDKGQKLMSNPDVSYTCTVKPAIELEGMDTRHAKYRIHAVFLQ